MSPPPYTEHQLVEQPAIALLAELGWTTVNALEEVLGLEGTFGRETRSDVVLSAFPFTALELAANIGEEQVAEVFVRINSQGKPLNQSDFILTLMSVFWDEGCSQLEAFSRKSKTPTVGDASPYNAFIEPSPDQMLRAAIGLGFKRARLQHVYPTFSDLGDRAIAARWNATTCFRKDI